MAVAFLLLAAACGDDSGSSASPTTDDEATTTTSTTVVEDDSTGDERAEAIDEFQEDVAGDIGIGLGSGSGTETDDDASADPEPGAGDPTSVAGYSGYVRVEDDSGTLSVEVPVEWSDVNGEAGLFGPDVVASTDVDTFLSDFSVPGVEFQATTLGNDTPEEVLETLSGGFASSCEAGPVQPYADPLYTGVSRNYLNCAGTDTAFVWVAVEPDDGSFIAIVGIQILEARDIEALGRVLDTFIVGA